MSEESDKITQFTAITGIPAERAKFFLDSAAGQVDVALANFYENEGGVDSDIEEFTSLPNSNENVVNNPLLASKSSSSSSKAKPTNKSKASNKKFATLNTLNKESDDEEEGQAFYAGGSEHSGQQVLGPSKKKDIVTDMFQAVHESGVEVVDQNPCGSTSRAFRGTGYKLGETGNDSVVIPGAAVPPPPNEVTLKLWKDGFSLNEGDLRPYSDPANKDFLESIRRGEIPQELRTGGSEVHLAMEDHRIDTFRPSSKKQKAFSGHGYTLGNPAPPVVGACRDEDKPLNEEAAKEKLNLDTTKPVTSIQIRLADGSRLIAQFNHAHTVGQIRSYILNARPQYATQEFNLMSSYPSKVLEDGQTIQEAGILNAAIMQKII